MDELKRLNEGVQHEKTYKLQNAFELNCIFCRKFKNYVA